MSDIALLGECMLELSPTGAAGEFRLGVAGDTYNTAAALARLGLEVEYLTALGEDRHSDYILQTMAELGIGSSRVRRNPGQAPGLYLIDNDSQGERFFSYWRRGSAAHQCLSDPEQLEALLQSTEDCPRLMLSGISLALCEEPGRAVLLDWLRDYRAAGGTVIYDGNYRPALWRDANQAGAAHRAMLMQVDVFLPGVEDELMLRDLEDASALLQQLQDSGIAEIVLKDGPGQVKLWQAGQMESVATSPVEHVVDTTAAGDSFNGGYLAARIEGCAMPAATTFACECAARTIQHRGAILPQSEWDSLRTELGRISPG